MIGFLWYFLTSLYGPFILGIIEGVKGVILNEDSRVSLNLIIDLMISHSIILLVFMWKFRKTMHQFFIREKLGNGG